MDEINAARGWENPRLAELELDEGIRREFFVGLNKYGAVITKTILAMFIVTRLAG